MHPQMRSLRCSIVRGGTSKGIFIKKNELPQDPILRDKVILAIYGSPDVRQIDGLGGGDVLTSKLAIIGPSTREDADVDYTFGQVSFETAFVDYGGNCGNISSAVGPYAIDEGLVAPVEPVTTVRIHLTNSGHLLTAQVPVQDGKAMVAGDYAIDGVPGSGARITLDWSQVVGTVSGGKLLPTGNVKDIIETNGVKYTVSLVDAGNPQVFIAAADLGMRGTESPAEIEGNRELMALIEKIRGRAAVLFGLVDVPEKAASVCPYIPFFAIVSPPADYTGLNKVQVKAEQVDLVSRLLFMLKMHKAYPISGTACTAAAVRIRGTVAWDALRKKEGGDPIVRIGHPAGVLDVESVAEEIDGEIHLRKIGTYRTARRIMDGLVYVKNEVFL
ncbi:MAG: 3-methylitaconate isomerase [Planctomycetes bacterium]|nr:3-methylitaconate isomerase [Planctomycetota bacterium]